MVALFGRYEYLHELGRGASGRVFAVRDLAEGGALRAIKVLAGASAGRLSWEFARLSSIDHEGVARVRELLRLTQPEHAPFRLSAPTLLLVEDLAQGQPLSRLVRGDAAYEEREAVAIRVLLAAASALAAIHAVGLVHGDVKPENLVVDETGARVTLVDLGFCEPPGFRAQPSGTPRYMAPELLAGLSSPAADVYALAGSVFDWLLGDAPDHVSSRAGGPLFVRRVEALRELGGAALADLLGTFLQADPALRPSDGRAAYLALVPLAQNKGVLSRADPALFTASASAAQRAARARTLPFVGRTALLTELETRLARDGAVLVAGARGAGTSRLVREALRRATLQRAEAAAPLPTIVRSIDALAGLCEVPTLLWLAPPEQRVADELSVALRLRALNQGRLALIVECSPLFEHDELARVTVGPVSRAELAELAAQLLLPSPLMPSVEAALYEASQGLVGRATELVAEALAAQRDVTDPRSFSARALTSEALSLGDDARRLGELFAWAGRAVSPEECRTLLGSQATLDGARNELWARGLLSTDGGFELSSDAARQLRAESADRRRQIGALLPDGTEGGGFGWLARGDEARAEQAFLSRAEELRRAGKVDAAAQLLREAVDFSPSEPLRWWLGDSERARADYAAALEALVPSQAFGARLLRAEVLRLRGERARSVEEAEALLASLAPSAEQEQVVVERARALLARLAFDGGELERARGLAQPLGHAKDAQAGLRALEVLLLVQLAEGLPARDAADALVQAALPLDARAQSRAFSLRAQLFARHAELSRALTDSARALELSRKAGEAHESASFAVNLGLMHMEAGELGLALASLNDAAFALSRIDRPSDLARVLYNAAALALCMGDDARAQALIAATERFLSAADASVRAFLRMLSAELLQRGGQLAQAAEVLEEALAQLPTQLSWVHTVLLARTALAQLSCGNAERGEHLLARSRQGLDGADGGARLELSAAEVRAALLRLDAGAAEQAAERGMETLSAQTPFLERLRFLLAAVDAARAAGRDAALRERTLLCRSLLEAALAGLSPPQRALMRARPEYGRVLSATAVQRDARGAGASDRWRNLVRSARRLFATSQRARIGNTLVELALELVHAERALLVACTDEGGFEVRARAELGPDSGAPAVFSRSVVQRVWGEGKALVTLEASRDLRLSAAQSIHALSVRSVVAVPIEGFGEAMVLYLDDRLRADAFGAEDLELIEDLAQLAREALRAALSRTRELRRARKAEQEASALTAALAQAPDAGTLKSASLIGVSPALARVIESARRVAKSDVSVLITGESGTGKELLARLVHEASQRRAQPFVAENCAALPDTLLESALFGHVRGAFTGADRARRGLFEVADQGTLFLDEVGEMSPALQAKLLRVLQEGELRPLGSERTRRVDVRVIAATRQDLSQRVRDGLFREDLYYRLAVVTLELPPLSARRDDIPLLVRHFVAKHQGKRGPVSVSAGALRALSQREYPGNVRQLENEVRRALALCEDNRIEAHDLSGGDAKGAAATGEELDLHAQLGALSDKLVAEALRRAGGNVTQAAALLGISRFGLQKMLKRTRTAPDQRK